MIMIHKKIEAALIFCNGDKLILNEKNTESYNGEDITIIYSKLNLWIKKNNFIEKNGGVNPKSYL